MVMASDIEIQTAAQNLMRYLANYANLTTIGIGSEDGKDCLFAYVKRLNKAERTTIPSEWEGFRVVLRKMGQPRPGLHS